MSALPQSAGREYFFHYKQSELDYLSGRDRQLGAFISQVGQIRRRIWPDAFSGLVRAITGQQISSRAHESVWQKFLARFGEPVAETIGAASLEEIRKCGISLRKAGYIKGVAAEFASGRLNHEMLAGLDNDALARRLTELPGIGKWTVEMLLIFTFCKPDILCHDDKAIGSGMMKLYGYEQLDKEKFGKHRASYSPHGTLASFYLWEAARIL